MLDLYMYLYVYIYIYLYHHHHHHHHHHIHLYVYLDLDLALFFLLIAVLPWIYARSDMLCSLGQGAFVFLTDVHLCFSWVFTLTSWKNTLIILASTCKKCKHAKSANMPKVVQLRSCGEKTIQKQKSLKWACICAFSGISVYTICIYIYTYNIYCVDTMYCTNIISQCSDYMIIQSIQSIHYGWRYLCLVPTLRALSCGGDPHSPGIA